MFDSFEVQKGAILLFILEQLDLGFMLRMIDNEQKDWVIWQRQDTREMF